ncbi:hypothetical protein TNCV_1115621 [Trichonephila clavipes]|nr:hypothetical protein TNCV_1115621 [Trichonephila clavipes]
MTIATLKDLIIGSENYDEELTKNIHQRLLRIPREENLSIEEQKEKLRFEQLRLDEQKREFELEKLRIQTQSKYEAPGKFEYNRKDKKFPVSYNKHYVVTKYLFKDIYNKNYEKHSNHNASSNAHYSKLQKFKEPPKETSHSSLRKVYVLKRFFGKVKITALIDSGSTVSLLRENTSRRIMDPTKLSKNKMLLIVEAQVIIEWESKSTSILIKDLLLLAKELLAAKRTSKLYSLKIERHI